MEKILVNVDGKYLLDGQPCVVIPLLPVDPEIDAKIEEYFDQKRKEKDE